LIYPNPATGDTITLHLSLTKTSDVTIKFISVAHRRVLVKTLPSVPAGTTDQTVVLKDNGGHVLANGLYYLVITSDDGRLIRKLLVAR
jgi:hypothetical protein